MWFAARGTLPVLDLDGERIGDSTAIIAELERRHPEEPLYPAPDDERRRALELEEFFDEELGHDVRRVAFNDWSNDYISALMTTAQPAVVRAPLRATLPIGMAWARRRYRIYPDDVEASRRKVEAALDLVEAELEGGEYLVGEGFTVADLTASSLLFPLAWPDETPYDLQAGPVGVPRGPRRSSGARSGCGDLPPTARRRRPGPADGQPTSTTASTSTGQSNGSSDAPIAERAWWPASPTPRAPAR